MTHAITHCKGIGCPIKHGCERYIAHTQVKEGERHNYDTEMYDHGSCCNYVRSEKEYQGITHFNNRNKLSPKRKGT